MEFIDYYGILNLPRDARLKDIQNAFDILAKTAVSADIFVKCSQAYSTLINPYKRARYDKSIGFLIVIHIKSAYSSYSNAKNFYLNSIQPFASLHSLIEKFKRWIEKKYDYDWLEAQEAHYSYFLESNLDSPYLLLRFPSENALESFEKYLRTNRLIKTD